MYRKSTVVSLLFLITLLALAAPLSIQAAPPGSTLADVQVNQDLVVLQLAETSVVMNPFDPRNVVVIYTDYSEPDLGPAPRSGTASPPTAGRPGRAESFPSPRPPTWATPPWSPMARATSF